MISTKRVSIVPIIVLGICIFHQNKIVKADNDIAWKVQWQYEGSCDNPRDPKCALNVFMDQQPTINVTISNLPINASTIVRVVSDTDIFQVPNEIELHRIDDKMYGMIIGDAIFIGNAYVHLEIDVNSKVEQSDSIHVIITRDKRLIDTLFIISVATLVSILYINFGAALDFRKVTSVLWRPIGPAIAFGCHFLFLPLASFALGQLLFPNNPAMQLGLFFTGASPAGGASNTWTVILGGSLDLSITMSTTSTLASFAMTPLWIFTLGKYIFDSAEMKVPYGQIASSVFSLIIPLGIGLLIQKYFPRCARFLVRILKPCSSLLILFIVVFAIVTNLYLFKLFTWQIMVAGLLLPWLGYFAGWLAAVLLRQNYEDRLAIAVEAGIQNTGIAIFVLRYALSQPEADLTTVMPVACAIMTPFPLIAFYICLQTRRWIEKRRSHQFPAEIKECIESQESGVY